MSTITENDIKELKGFIVEQFKEVNQKIDKSSEQVNQRIDKLSEDVDNKIDKLSENLHKEIKQLSKDFDGKVGKLSEDVNSLRVEVANVKGELTGVNKRLDSLDFTNRTIFVAIVTALMAGLVKLFLPNFTS